MDKIINKRISEVDYSVKDQIIISFDNTILKLHIEGYDYYDRKEEYYEYFKWINWFEIIDQPFSSIVGKIFKDVNEIDNPQKYHDDNAPIIIEIEFTDNTLFKFLLKNSSKGNFDSYVEMYVGPVDKFGRTIDVE